MIIDFNIPNCFHPKARKRESSEALEALMECLIRLNECYLRLYPNTPPLYDSGVVYGRTDDWLNVPACVARTYADCKSLTAWRIAERRIRGDYCTPVHRWIKNPDGSGATNYHILIENSDGTFEDPSKRLGMLDNENRRR